MKFKDKNNDIHDPEMSTGGLEFLESRRPELAPFTEITDVEVAELLAPTPEEAKALQIQAIESALQKVMDDEAQTLGYDNIVNAITYAAETAVAKFSTDGKSFRKWRSLVWKYAYDSLAQFETDMAAYLLAVDAYNQYLLDMAQYNLDLTQYSADILVMPAITPTPVVPTPPIEVLAPVEVVAPTVEDIITNMPVRS